MILANIKQESMNELALSRLDPKKMADMYGAVLNAAVRKSLISDPIFLELESTSEIKNYKQTTRARVLRELIEAAHTEQDFALTVSDYNSRKVRLDEVTGFVQRIEKSSLIPATIETPDDIDLEQDFPEGGGASTNQFEDPEADAEDSMEASQFRGYDNDTRPSDPSVSYLSGVRSFMEIILHSLMNADQSNEFEPTQCPRCLDDRSVTRAPKEKVWNNRYHLQTHMTTDFHSDYRRFCREADLAAASEEDKKYRCPYCKEIFDNYQPVFPSLRALLGHVTGSSDKILKGRACYGKDNDPSIEQIEQHETLKELAGWQREDFKSDPEVKEKRERGAAVRGDRAKGITYSNATELDEPIPHISRPYIQHGAPENWEEEIARRTEPGTGLGYEPDHEALQEETRRRQALGIFTEDPTPTIEFLATWRAQAAGVTSDGPPKDSEAEPPGKKSRRQDPSLSGIRAEKFSKGTGMD